MVNRQEYKAVMDISPEYDQPFFTEAEGGFDRSWEYCKTLKGKSADILMRMYTLSDGRRCGIVMVDGMVDKATVERSVVLASRRLAEQSGLNKFSEGDDLLQQFGSTEFSVQKSLSAAYISALTGDVMLIIEGLDYGYTFGYRKIQSRSVSESPNEGSVQGPHEAFTENLRTNTGLLRRRISDPNMVIEHLKVGSRSHTSVALCYIRGLTNPELYRAVKERIDAISIDIINDSGELAQLLEETPGNIFPQTDGSERPDTVASELCSGRIAIIVNGSPHVLLLPTTLSRLMRVNEDDYQRWSYAAFIKVLRWAALALAAVAPAAYVAIISYHPGLLPTDLLLISASNRANVPFTAVFEVLIMEFSLELLREAGIRMPRSIGTSLSIVGGLIIGDAAINAGLVSPLLIIIISLSTLANLTIPSYAFASSMRLIKYMLILLSAVLGLLGLTAGIIIWTAMMVRTRSFGVDFTAPFSPLWRRGLWNGLLELPMKYRARRPRYLDPMDSIRMGKQNG
ncbi:MAG: spore germination protein [Ruminococcaceae bacterium]|nr:spore germination protein [Oscillospiraceae bacterium]